jgi:phage repressor protein C with HTH and peptisase S24 domain
LKSAPRGTKAKLAAYLGVRPEVITRMISSKGEVREITADEAVKIAEFFERRTVAVVGRIGAGAEISPDEEQVPEEGLFEIETPFPLPADAIAFEVAGVSMWPRYDEGDVVICWKEASDLHDVYGREAAVKTTQGHRYLKRVLRGRNGTVDLESHNAAPIRGARLEWASLIRHVVRSGQWRAVEKRRHAAV